jgi:hypothetical protein
MSNLWDDVNMVMTVKMRGFTFEYGDEFVDLGTDLGLKE